MQTNQNPKNIIKNLNNQQLGFLLIASGIVVFILHNVLARGVNLILMLGSIVIAAYGAYLTGYLQKFLAKTKKATTTHTTKKSDKN
ncbi:hypothetical protein KG892_04280 [Vermiphilus pyriformis]|uniref:Uncharacterized protein n=1 Tax=candidate division TM6 bacterium JCVI TM6SC1 TaxID=1306947 RepID=A0A0D2K4I1_9BACT|nr:hypothetical protein J120_02245 [candidate division TM6 bacterium JCVI TM6SC1]UNE35183.1 MAG: hypothetical protein KG892_04280 [Vermiphilus pyriformis]